MPAMEKSDHVEIPVWDPVLRCLHWWNAAMLTIQLLTGVLFLLDNDEATTNSARGTIEQVHGFVGYALAAGVLTRLLWLFIGPETASWRDLLPITRPQRRLALATLRSYTRANRRPAPAWFGHNPLAALAYLAFFLIASVQVVAGVNLLNMPAADRDGTLLLEVHETGFFLLAGYVTLHLSAVFFHQFGERRPLIQALFTGRKRFSEEELAAIEGLPGVPTQTATEGE
jgi:Ni/Fe-hydrogenase 1 B-type cytochrome subunit